MNKRMLSIFTAAGLPASQGDGRHGRLEHNSSSNKFVASNLGQAAPSRSREQAILVGIDIAINATWLY